MQDYIAAVSLVFCVLTSIATLVAALMVARERAARAELRNELREWVEAEFICRNDLALIEARLGSTHDFCNELKGNVLPTIAAKLGVELKWKS